MGAGWADATRIPQVVCEIVTREKKSYFFSLLCANLYGTGSALEDLSQFWPALFVGE